MLTGIFTYCMQVMYTLMGVISVTVGGGQ